MKANVFLGKNKIRVEEVDKPRAGVGEAVIRVTLTTICGTDLHIVRGEYPVAPGLVIGHEPVGVIEELGDGVSGYAVGDRVLVGAITPCGQCSGCLSGHSSQCGHGEGYEALGGWRFGNTINGAQAEYLKVPYAQANLAKIPDELTDEQVVLLADIASTGFSGAESAGIKIGDSVVVFAQGPIGLCATAGAKLMGAGLIIGVDGDENRLAMSKRMGADVTLDYRDVDVVAEIKRLTGGGADVSIEALGTQQTFESALRSLRPAGTLSSLGVYSARDSLRSICRRYWRSPDRHDALPWRQRTHAQIDGGCAAWPRRSHTPTYAHFRSERHRPGLRSVWRATGRCNESSD
jgi:threonine dehydrogenase-like Zn-dependent dehydrogenase